MTTVAFTVDPAKSGQGVLIVTDPKLLIRPAPKNMDYPRYAKHDVRRASLVLELGNAQYGSVPYHLIFGGGADEAHVVLDRVFHYYVDGCVMQLDCDARVDYKQEGKLVRTEEYGVENLNYTMCITVHCGVADPEAFAAELVAKQRARCVVVSPDDSELGYVARGYQPTYVTDAYL